MKRGSLFALLLLLGACGGPDDAPESSLPDIIDIGPENAPPPSCGDGATTIATGDSEHSVPSAITVYGDDVFWTDTQAGNFAEDFGQGTIMHGRRCGGHTTTLANEQFLPVAIAADGAGVYWINEGRGSSNAAVMALPVGASTPVVLATAPGRMPKGFAVDDGFVYWSDLDTASFTSEHPAGQGRVMRVAKTGGAASVVATVDDGYAEAIGVDATDVYWVVLTADAPRIDSLSKLGGTQATFMKGVAADLGALTMSATDFFVTPDYVAVEAVSKTNAEVKTKLGAGGRVAKLATDGSGVVWIDIGTPGTSRIMGAARNGGEVATLAVDKATFSGIATAYHQVYFTRGAGKSASVMAVATPW